MPSNDHKKLYLQLQDITARIKTALGKEDYGALPQMMSDHQGLMKQITDLGECSDPNMLPFLNEIKSNVDEVVREIEMKKGDSGEKIRISANKRKLAKAY